MSDAMPDSGGNRESVIVRLFVAFLPCLVPVVAATALARRRGNPAERARLPASSAPPWL